MISPLRTASVGVIGYLTILRRDSSSLLKIFLLRGGKSPIIGIILVMIKSLPNTESDSNTRKYVSAGNHTALTGSILPPGRVADTEPLVGDNIAFCSGTRRDRHRHLLKLKGKVAAKTTANLPGPSVSVATEPSTTLAEVPTPELVEDACHTVMVGESCFAMLQDEIRAQRAQGKHCSERQILEQVLGYYFATMYLNTVLAGRPTTHCSASYIAKMHELSALPR